MKSPLVSFCIPVHNSENFLEQTLLSILAQDYENFEIICVNDHSSDNSLQILKQFGNKISYHNADKKGAAAARNLAYIKSKGEYTIFFDSDDIIPQDFLSGQITALCNHQNGVAVSKWGRFYTDVDDFQEDDFIVKNNLTFKEWICLYWKNNRHMTPPGRVIVPRAIIEKAGLWNEALSLNDDFDFFVRVFSFASKIVYNDKSCFCYRSGIGGLSTKIKGFKYQQSNFLSIASATNIALAAYPNDEDVKLACANVWQQFIYENYPHNKPLVAQAKNKVNELGGSNFQFIAGGMTKIAVKLFGWKLAKQMISIVK